MAQRGLLERNQVVEFPILQLAAAALKQHVDVVTVRSLGYAGAAQARDSRGEEREGILLQG